MSEWSASRTEQLLGDLLAFVRRFVILTDAQALAVALWVLHSHAFDAADTTPYLSITSAEKQSGKTRLLELLDLLVAKPWLTSRVTPAVLSRKVDRDAPTLLLDESDMAFKSDKEYAAALTGILNSGYKRGGVSSICVGPSNEPRDLGTFCPKAIAGIGKLPDTVTDRSIPIRLERKARGEGVERFRRRLLTPHTMDLRDLLADWAIPNLDALRDAWPELPEQLDDRAQDVWEPLLAIADLAGDEWPARARSAATELSGASKEDESLGVRLLADIRTLFERWAVDRISTADLLPELAADVEAPWGHWRGKPMSGQTLAEFLKAFGIRSRTIWMGNGQTAKGYLREQFEAAWARYLPSGASGPSGAATGTGSPVRQGAVRPPSGPVTGDVRPSGAVMPDPFPETEPDGLTPLTAGANGHVPESELSLLADVEHLVREGDATLIDET